MCEVLALEICSSYHLVAITVTRYIAIVHPLRYHIYVTTKTTTIAIAVIWILSQGSSLVMYTMYNPGKVWSLLNTIYSMFNVRTVAKPNRKIVVNLIPLTHKYITAHFLGLGQILQ